MESPDPVDMKTASACAHDSCSTLPRAQRRPAAWQAQSPNALSLQTRASSTYSHPGRS